MRKSTFCALFDHHFSYRKSLWAFGALALFGFCLGLAGASRLLAVPAGAAHDQGLEVTPGEDLMREHGVLRRALLVYEAALDLPLDQQSKARGVIVETALLIQRFIENYHEKMEEDFIFPRFEQAGKLVELVRTLKTQHEWGRAVTQQVIALCLKPDFSKGDRVKLFANIHAFVAMYRVHAAREDTVLFPAFHALVGQQAYEKLGEQFEEREHQIFGEEGFEAAVQKVTELEDRVKIGNLAQYTRQPIQ